MLQYHRRCCVHYSEQPLTSNACSSLSYSLLHSAVMPQAYGYRHHFLQLSSIVTTTLLLAAVVLPVTLLPSRPLTVFSAPNQSRRSAHANNEQLTSRKVTCFLSACFSGSLLLYLSSRTGVPYR
jgi:hypothetical protein